MYINYYKNEVNDEMDENPIGIILCADKQQELVNMSIQGINNNIYAAKYTMVMPCLETLQEEVRKVVEEYEKR